MMKNKYEKALELMSESDPNIKRVIHLLEESVEEGNSEASYALATWYLHGTNLSKNINKGAALLNNAADTNHPDACFDLAICYEKGAGVSQSFEKAFELYLRAALYGDKQSFCEVGRCYYYGIGIGVDKIIADIWYEKAESLGVEGIGFEGEFEDGIYP